MTKFWTCDTVPWVSILHTLWVKWVQAVIMQALPYMCPWNTEMCENSSGASNRAILYHFKKVFLCSCDVLKTLENILRFRIWCIINCQQYSSQHSYSDTINSQNSQLTLHTDSHGSESGAVWQEKTILDSMVFA
jgi:hypothetical protein